VVVAGVGAGRAVGGRARPRGATDPRGGRTTSGLPRAMGDGGTDNGRPSPLEGPTALGALVTGARGLVTGGLANGTLMLARVAGTAL
jgi:hypothetical protein